MMKSSNISTLPGVAHVFVARVAGFIRLHELW